MSVMKEKMLGDCRRAADKAIGHIAQTIIEVRQAYEMHDVIFKRYWTGPHSPTEHDLFIQQASGAQYLEVINGLFILGDDDKRKVNEGIPYIVDKLKKAEALNQTVALELEQKLQTAVPIFRKVSIVRSKYLVHRDRDHTMRTVFTEARLRWDEIDSLITIYFECVDLILKSIKTYRPLETSEDQIALNARRKADRALDALITTITQ